MGDKQVTDKEFLSNAMLSPEEKIEQLERYIGQIKEEIKQLKKISKQKEKLEKLEHEKNKILSKNMKSHRRKH